MTWQNKLRGLTDRRAGADSGRRADPVGPGTDGRHVRLAPGLTLVADGGAALDAEPLGNRGWLVSRRGGSAAAELNLITKTLKHLAGRHVAWLLDRYQVDCVLDVGANAGRFAKGLRHNGYRGHIVSVEPVPAIAAALAKKAKGDPRWTTHQMALGSAPGTVPMHVQRTFSSLLPSTEYGRQRFPTLEANADSELVDVPVRRLDSVLDELLAPVVAAGIKQPRLYLKMDTQGFDLEVFRGIGERLADVVGLQSEVALLLIYEQMPRMPAAVATYEAAGFEIAGLYPVTREPDGRVIEFDCLMVRADACP